MRVVAGEGAVGAGGIAGAGPLDLDDVGAEVGEVAGAEGAGNVMGEGEDLHSVEGAGAILRHALLHGWTSGWGGHSAASGMRHRRSGVKGGLGDRRARGSPPIIYGPAGVCAGGGGVSYTWAGDGVAALPPLIWFDRRRSITLLV